MTSRVPVTFVIPTKNEEANLSHSLASVSGWAARVFVVDSGSTDRTREIAETHGATFVFHEWCGFAAQKNWAVDNLPIETPWVFILDADEAVTPELRRSVSAVATADACPENGFHVNRHFIFLGKKIRHCGYYPSWNLRFFRRGKARYEERAVHEHMLVDGPVGYLEGDMEHNDRRGIEYYIAKHNQYSTLEAEEMFQVLTGKSRAADEAALGGPLGKRRWVKQRVWPRLPMRWAIRFLYMYVLRLGFLDGRVGFHFCLFLAGYEHWIQLKLSDKLREHREGER